MRVRAADGEKGNLTSTWSRTLSRVGEVLWYLAAVLDLMLGKEQNMGEEHGFIMQVPDPLQMSSSVRLRSMLLNAHSSYSLPERSPLLSSSEGGKCRAPSPGTAVQHGQDFFLRLYQAAALSFPLCAHSPFGAHSSQPDTKPLTILI